MTLSPLPFSTPDAGISARLDAYFADLRTAHQQAAGKLGATELACDLAGHRLELRTVGHRLRSVLTSALTHLPSATPALPRGLEIFAWDEAETLVPLPRPPWEPPPAASANATPRLVLPPGGESYRITLAEQDSLFIMYSLERGQAVIWTRDAARLPTYVHSAPFPSLIHWWAQQHHLLLLHAGCVGTAAGAALLVGKSGSGKSTTALHCALAGFRYLSDDLCLVRTQPAPNAYCPSAAESSCPTR
jgi:hypothetical protein